MQAIGSLVCAHLAALADGRLPTAAGAHEALLDVALPLGGPTTPTQAASALGVVLCRWSGSRSELPNAALPDVVHLLREDWAWADGPVTSDDLEDLPCWFPQMTVLQPERTL